MASTEELVKRYEADIRDMRQEIWSVMERYDYLQSEIIERRKYIKELKEDL